MFRRCLAPSVKEFSFSYFNIRKKHTWKLPAGYDTGIKIYNSIIDKNVPLILLNKHFAKWYICGPTVYDEAHVGHACCYIRFDLIRRILENYFNIRTITGLGITDIDDKIINKSRELKTDFKLLAKKYELQFFANLQDLNVLPPTVVLRVTENIPEIISFISQIISRGHAYATDDGDVYFDVEAAGNYGKLVKLSERCDEYVGKKKCSMDFALWKASKPDEPFWTSPWSNGRPGWHIECSAMSSKVFGSNLDLHSGGIDLIFPHHENEEAQSCSYHGCEQWVNYWMHAGSVHVGDAKMSKSLQNYVAISDCLKTYTADNLRMYCFASQYGNGLHYSPEAMAFSVSACNKISGFLADSKSYIRGNWNKGNISEALLLQKLEEVDKSIRNHLMNDFNTAGCFLSLMELVRDSSKMLHDEIEATNATAPCAVAAVSQYIERTFNSFGFQISSSLNKGELDDINLEHLLGVAINFRSNVRGLALSSSDQSVKKNLLQASDSFRDDLKLFGISIKDLANNESSWGRS